MAIQARFKTVKVEVEISGTKLRGYEIAKGDEGWLFYDPITELAKKQQITSTYMPQSAFLEFGEKDERTVLLLDRDHLKGAILHPYLRLAPQIVGGEVSVPDVSWATANYAFSPDAANWDFTRSESGLFIECTQKYLYPPGTTQAEIEAGTVGPLTAAMGYRGSGDEGAYVGMCPNGFFAAGVRRSAIPEEAEAWLERNLSYSAAQYTNIYFGSNPPQQRWCLRVPLVGAPVLYENTHYLGAAPPGWTWLYPNWVVRPWTEGSLKAVNPSKAAKEGLTYRIGAIGHAICVSESTFEDDFAYYMVGEDQPVDPQDFQPVIPAGPVMIHNWPGQCTMWLDLMMFPQQGWLYRYPFTVPGYDLERAHTYCNGQPFSLPDVAGNEIGPVLIEGSQVAGELPVVHYSVPLARGQYPGEGAPAGELQTYTTPFLQAVTVYQDAKLTENAVLWTKPQNVPLELTSDMEMGKSEAQHHRLQLDNRQITNPKPAGEPAPEAGWVPTGALSPGRDVRLKVGWIYETAEIPVIPRPDLEAPEGEEGEPDWTIPVWTEVPALVQQGIFTVIEPSYDPREGNFDLTDLLGILNLKRWEWGTLCARGWYVYDFVTWLLRDAGIGPKWYDIEDLQTLIPDDSENATWKAGTSYARIISECVDRFGHGIIAPGSGDRGRHHVGASLWYDGQVGKIKTGCRYCRTKRTLANWESHEDNGWASSGCLAADVARIATGVDFVMVDTPVEPADYSSLFIAKKVQVKVAPLHPDKYANRIVVIGKAPAGYPIYSRWTNEAALYHGEGTPGEEYVGFPVTHIEEDDTLTTQELADARLNQLKQWLSSWPRVVSITAPLIANAKPGHVLKVTAGQYAGIHGKTFRVTGVNHRARSHETGLEAREIIGTGGGVE